MRLITQIRRKRTAGAPAAQAFLRLSEGEAELDFQTSGLRRMAALFLAMLFLVAVPLLWANSAAGGDAQQATVPSKSGSSSGSGGADDDDDDADDSTAGDVTTSGATENTAGTANTGDTNTTAGPEDTGTGATNTTAGDDGTTDSTATTDAPGMTDTGTTSGDLIVAANGKVNAGAPIKVRANCGSGCEVEMRASVKGPSSSGDIRVKTRKVTKTVDANGMKLKLRLDREARSEVKEAAQEGKFMKRAKVVVKAKADSGGAKQSEKLRLKLK